MIQLTFRIVMIMGVIPCTKDHYYYVIIIIDVIMDIIIIRIIVIIIFTHIYITIVFLKLLSVFSLCLLLLLNQLKSCLNVYYALLSCILISQVLC